MNQSAFNKMGCSQVTIMKQNNTATAQKKD